MNILKLAFYTLLAINLTACGPGAKNAETEVSMPTPEANFSGVWKTSYGDIYFPRHESSEVRGAFWSYPESNGKADNGRIVATIDGNKLSGYWIEDSGTRPCDFERDGSLYWGPVRFEGNHDFSVISGAWGACENEPEGDDAAWVGNRD